MGFDEPFVNIRLGVPLEEDAYILGRITEHHYDVDAVPPMLSLCCDLRTAAAADAAAPASASGLTLFKKIQVFKTSLRIIMLARFLQMYSSAALCYCCERLDAMGKGPTQMSEASPNMGMFTMVHQYCSSSAACHCREWLYSEKEKKRSRNQRLAG